jgi:hypothetical protein
VRLAACVAAFARRGGVVPAPRVGAESGWSDSPLRQDVSAQHQGPLLVEGKPSYPLSLAKGPKGKGGDLIHGAGGPWRQAPWEPGVSSVRLRATSPTEGEVTSVIVEEPGQARCSWLWRATARSAPQLIRRWRRRPWSAFVCRTLKHR